MKRAGLSLLAAVLLASIQGPTAIFAGHGARRHGFATIYRDERIRNSNGGLDWSKSLHGVYSNGCIGAEGEYDLSACKQAPGGLMVQVQDSAAAKACELVGGRLPTAAEYTSLIGNFDHWNDPDGDLVLTSKGRAEMQAVFGDMSHWFWTSTIEASGNVGLANLFSGGGGDIHYDFRESTYAVRCVWP